MTKVYSSISSLSYKVTEISIEEPLLNASTLKITSKDVLTNLWLIQINKKSINIITIIVFKG